MFMPVSLPLSRSLSPSRVPQMLPMICKRTQLFILSQMILLIKSRNRLVFSKPTTSGGHPVPFLSYHLHLQLRFQFSSSLSLSIAHSVLPSHSIACPGMASHLLCVLCCTLLSFSYNCLGPEPPPTPAAAAAAPPAPLLRPCPACSRHYSRSCERRLRLIRKRSHLLALS